jgi:hypothetical protein
MRTRSRLGLRDDSVIVPELRIAITPDNVVHSLTKGDNWISVGGWKGSSAAPEDRYYSVASRTGERVGWPIWRIRSFMRGECPLPEPPLRSSAARTRKRHRPRLTVASLFEPEPEPEPETAPMTTPTRFYFGYEAPTPDRLPTLLQGPFQAEPQAEAECAAYLATHPGRPLVVFALAQRRRCTAHVETIRTVRWDDGEPIPVPAPEAMTDSVIAPPTPAPPAANGPGHDRLPMAMVPPVGCLDPDCTPRGIRSDLARRLDA